MAMSKKTLILLGICAVAVVAMLIVAACDQSGGAKVAKSGQTLATVGNSTITTDDFNEILKRIPPFNRKRYTTKEGKMELLDKLVEEDLFYQEALRRGLDKEAEFTARIEQIRQGILASMVKKELYEQEESVSEAEVKDYYEKNKENFMTPETVKVKLLLVRLKRNATPEEEKQAKAKADQAAKELKSGASWEKVVDKYSDDRASKKKGGLLPKVRKGLRGEEFDAVAFAMTKPGQISDVFRDKRGFNIIQFEEKEEAKVKDFEEVKTTIDRRIKQEKLKKKMDSTMANLRTKANVKINQDVLDGIQVDVGPEGAEGGMPGMPGLPQMGGPGAPVAPGGAPAMPPAPAAAPAAPAAAPAAPAPAPAGE